MNRFGVYVTLVCPSNWEAEDCRRYVERICATSTEHVHHWLDQIIPLNASLPKPVARQEFEILVLRVLALLLAQSPVPDWSVYREIMERLKR